MDECDHCHKAGQGYGEVAGCGTKKEQNTSDAGSPEHRNSCCDPSGFCEKWRAVSFEKKLEIVLLSLALVAAIFAAFFTGQQFIEMRNQTKAAQDGLKQVSQTVEAAQESNRLQRAAIEADNRAWVVAIVPGKSPLTASHSLKVDVKLRNVGKVPAMNARSVSYHRQLPPEIPFDPIMIDIKEDAARSILGPNETLVTGPTIPALSYEDIERIRNGTSILYVYGYGVYDDLFVKGRLYTFCRYWMPIDESWAICDRFNESP